MIIKNGLVFTQENTFHPHTITTAHGIITEILEASADVSTIPETVFDASGCYVIPGLTDIHFHGCDGHDFCEGTQEALDAISRFQFTQGITSICPATMTLPEDRISAICRNAADYHKKQKAVERREHCADLIGIYMEGPFINPKKKGAQNASYIQAPSGSMLRNRQRDAKGLIRLVSIAPEVPGALACIKECSDEFRFSIGHTESDYDTSIEAFFAGANQVTHLYNAMPPFAHRAPGVIGAAFDTPECFVEIICDGVHVHPGVVRATFRLFGDDRIILISDSMEATGRPDGKYTIGDLEVCVKGNHATLSDGTLAGSVSSLYQCMLTAVSMGIPLESAVKAATINPCRSIGADSLYGSICAHKKAHFLVLKKEDLSIKAIIKEETISRF